VNGPIFLPPPGFRPVGQVVRASFGDPPPEIQLRKKRTRRDRFGAGKLYERKALSWLAGHEDLGKWIRLPWIRFTTEGADAHRWCQPDALLVSKDVVVIFEIKIRHTLAAYWQLRKVYEPVVRALCSERVEVCEVTRFGDPAVPWPEDTTHLFEPKETLELAGRFGILTWR
jgi:hypothetical protein